MKKSVLFAAAALGSVLTFFIAAQSGPVIRYKVIPDPSGAQVRVEAAFRLQDAAAYLRDFGQVESIRWSVNGVEVKVKTDRQGDVLFFNGLPASGDALGGLHVELRHRAQAWLSKEADGVSGFHPGAGRAFSRVGFPRLHRRRCPMGPPGRMAPGDGPRRRPAIRRDPEDPLGCGKDRGIDRDQGGNARL